MSESATIAAAATAIYDMTRALYTSEASFYRRERNRDEACVPIPNVGGVGMPFV